jgi:tetratricopeptide (TPR) repeat protein
MKGASSLFPRRPWAARLAASAGSILLVLCLACAPKADGPKPITLDQLLQGASGEGLQLENPFSIDPAIAAQVEQKVGSGGTATDRMRRLTFYLNERKFDYVANRSLTATEAFNSKRGDCMAYTNLYMALARSLRIPTFFVHISEVQNYYERDGLFFVSSHMAVGCQIQYFTVIVDFTEQKSEYTLALYNAVDDATAAALFYNNLAVDHLMSGDVEYAEKLLRYLIRSLPHLKEAKNNLGVVLMRQGRFREALVVLQEALEQSPEYKPLYTNAIQAARGAGDPALADQISRQGESIMKRDPFYVFNEGVERFHEKDYAGALVKFQRVLSREAQSPMLYAWIARTRLSIGQESEGIKAFEEAQKLAPYLPMLRSLRQEFPSLSAVPLPSDPEVAQPGGTPQGGSTSSKSSSGASEAPSAR